MVLIYAWRMSWFTVIHEQLVPPFPWTSSVTSAAWDVLEYLWFCNRGFEGFDEDCFSTVLEMIKGNGIASCHHPFRVGGLKVSSCADELRRYSILPKRVEYPKALTLERPNMSASSMLSRPTVSVLRLANATGDAVYRRTLETNKSRDLGDIAEQKLSTSRYHSQMSWLQWVLKVRINLPLKTQYAQYNL